MRVHFGKVSYGRRILLILCSVTAVIAAAAGFCLFLKNRQKKRIGLHNI